MTIILKFHGKVLGRILEATDEEEKLLRIKRTLSLWNQLPDEVLLGTLRKLQSMNPSSEKIKAMKIGEVVGYIMQKHTAEHIKSFARALLTDWKLLDDRRIKADEETSCTSIETKLESAKRKLREGYQEANNAKKHRGVKLLDFKDLPKNNLPLDMPKLKKNCSLEMSKLKHKYLIKKWANMRPKTSFT